MSSELFMPFLALSLDCRIWGISTLIVCFARLARAALLSHFDGGDDLDEAANAILLVGNWNVLELGLSLAEYLAFSRSNME